MTLQVLFQPGNIPVKTDGDQDILSLARQAGFLIDSQCGGQGTCDRCQMSLVSGQLVDVRVTETRSYTLRGEVLTNEEVTG